LKYRGYYYDSETGFYYVSSRYYDPEIGRFISADNIDLVLASQTVLTDKNLYAYCDNNPVIRMDEDGYFWIEVGIVAAGGVVGAMMGAFSAAATGGNVMQGVIKGGLTGILGSACGLVGKNPVWSGAVASIVDLGIQAVDMYNERGNIDLLELNYTDALITGVETAIGVAVKPVGVPTDNIIDAIGTAIVWSEVAVGIACADVVGRNICSAVKTKKGNSNGNNKKCRILAGMTTADYFRSVYCT
jgi:RHS repeat-associated protein